MFLAGIANKKPVKKKQKKKKKRTAILQTVRL